MRDKTSCHHTSNNSIDDETENPMDLEADTGNLSASDGVPNRMTSTIMGLRLYRLRRWGHPTHTVDRNQVPDCNRNIQAPGDAKAEAKVHERA